MFRLREALQQRRRFRRIRARNQQIWGTRLNVFGDGDGLFHRLPQRENHFGNAVPQRPVMIHLSEAQVFKRQVAHPPDRLIDFQCARLHAREKFA